MTEFRGVPDRWASVHPAVRTYRNTTVAHSKLDLAAPLPVALLNDVGMVRWVMGITASHPMPRVLAVQLRDLIEEVPSGDAIGLWVPSATAFDRFSLAAIRRSSLPQSELNGTLSDLNLGAGAGLHEPVHMKVLPNNILGVEFNFYGPRPTRLPIYLHHTVPGFNEFMLEALLRKDVAAQLKNHSEIRMLDLYIRPSYVASIEEANKRLGKAFRSIRAASDAEVIGVTLRPEPYKRTPLGTKVLKGVKRLAKRQDLNENVSAFKVRGFNEVEDRTEVLDLLQDQLVAKKQILTLGDRSRAIDPISAFDAIDEAYDELRTQIETSAGIGVVNDGDGASEEG